MFEQKNLPEILFQMRNAIQMNLHEENMAEYNRLVAASKHSRDTV